MPVISAAALLHRGAWDSARDATSWLAVGAACHVQPVGPARQHARPCPCLQAVFEGMKAQRTAKDRIVLFRPDANADRMIEGKTSGQRHGWTGRLA